MEFSLIQYVQILSFIQMSRTQYQNYYNGAVDQAYYPTEDIDYSHMYTHRSRGRRGHHGHSGGRLPSMNEPSEEQTSRDTSDECDCKCSKCDIPEPCCQQICAACNQQSLIFVPYPYPLLVKMPSNVTTSPTKEIERTQTTTETTTTETTTTETTTTTTTTTEATKAKTIARSEQISRDLALNDLLKTPPNRNGDSKFILTSLRRMKDHSLPKYGIVPIPDQLAESLMSQMRTMKVINSHLDRY